MHLRRAMPADLSLIFLTPSSKTQVSAPFYGLFAVLSLYYQRDQRRRVPPGREHLRFPIIIRRRIVALPARRCSWTATGCVPDGRARVGSVTGSARDRF